MNPNIQSLARLLGGVALAVGTIGAQAVPLADAPIFATQSVPGNLALALSVEYPTAISVANLGNYVHANTYLGYFDPNKCYTYSYNATTPNDSYFQPSGLANSHSCTGQWSGNFMNWVSMQTIDPFRWALTGGYRATDTTSMTILQKAFGTSQGSAAGNYPYRGTHSPTAGNTMVGTDVTRVTPFSGTRFNTRLWGKGVDMVFSTKDSNNYQSNTPTDLVHYGNGTSASETYTVRIRVRVCDSSASAGGVESNCVQYGSNYKPEGLLQQYSNKIRYSAFAYLTDGGNTRQGAALRAKMGFIGPTYPIPLSTTPGTNATGEWSATTGIMGANPDPSMGAAQSGVMNYLNQFGNFSSTYKTYDNVSELYYAAIRYFQNLGNVPEWTNGATAVLRDNFPAATTWTDPILYSCQKNFILGIGDSNTHFDINTGGNGGLTNQNGTARPMPPLVAADSFNQSAAWTRLIEQAEGLTSRALRYGATPGSEFIAGLAYGNHVNDMRSDLAGTQTINTYWMDVMEGQYAQDKSPYWLAAKYGGFTVPNGFNATSVAAMQGLAANTWSNTSEALIDMYARGTFNASNPANNRVQRPRPHNFFLAGNAAQMVSGLTTAFNSIAQAVNSYTTAVTPAANVVTSAGTTSYSASYGSEFWTGTVKASTLAFTTNGPTQTALWDSTTVLNNQFGNNGANRVIISWDQTASAGIPFQIADLPATAKTALDTGFVSGDDSANYLQYLRGDKTHEVNSTATGSLQVYRERKAPLGDIVNSKLTLSAAPKMPYTDVGNPGYSAFKTARAARTPLLLFGANDGMLHALNGSATGTDRGKEVFAYVPSATFYGPNGTAVTNARADGLAAIGNPNYAHRFYVDATPQVFDVDFNKVAGATGSADWRTIVVGGLGKGGKSFYAIDITDPSTMTTEASAKSKVLWEINSSTPGFQHLGFSYGTPVMVKTAKYGWTLLLTSGYNNDDGIGYLYLVNPRTGALLTTLSTGSAAPGMTQASAFINDYTDGTADAVYVGDLSGQLWRFDLTSAAGTYPSPTLLFTATSSDNTAQPITVAPIPEIHPTTRERMILFGTGRLLDGQDISSAQEQSFYAISDGDNIAFNPSGTTLTRSNLTAVPSLVTAVTLPVTSRGWYHDLGKTNNIGWRVTITPTAADGIVLFTSTLPSGDPCSPAGKGRFYAVDYSRGFSALDGNTVGYGDLANAPTENVLFKVDGELVGQIGDTGGQLTPVKLVAPGALGVRLINWREVEAVD